LPVILLKVMQVLCVQAGINDNKSVILVICECVEFVLFALSIDKHATDVCARNADADVKVTARNQTGDSKL
jgi:hypothetical protein